MLKFIFHIFSNAVALFAAAYFVSGFQLNMSSYWVLVVTALILTLINTFIKPFFSFFLGPLVLLTFGLFSIVINMGTLYVLDLLSENLTITGTLPLLYGTLIVSIVNTLLEFFGSGIYTKKEA